MVILTKEEFKFIYNRLNSPKDVDLIHERLGMPKNMLFNVLGRKITRDTTSRFYQVKAKSKSMLRKWKRGKTIYEIAKEHKFPPTLICSFILEEYGYSKKRTKMLIKDNDLIEDSRLRRDVKAAIKKDFAYSPSSSETQMKNSKTSEGGIEFWLKKKKVKYLTEEQNREIEHHERTPDFLLKKKIKIKGRVINWIESKASFGDVLEIRRDFKKQLGPYTKFFGPGAVVYWYGYVYDNGFDNDVLVLTKEDFQ